MLIVLVVALLLWIAFNVLAPYAVLLRAEPISWGRLPAELLTSKKDKKIRFYLATLQGSYGYSVFSLGLNLVVFDRRFFAQASSELKRFVIAHELAHFHRRHHQKRWLFVVTGLVLLPVVRRRLLTMEDDADAEAVSRTGLIRSSFPELG